MAIEIIERTPADEAFRSKVRESLNSAEREIIVITGEFGSYDFPELKEALQRAIDREVEVKIYAVSPHPNVIQELRGLGAEFYLGTKYTNDHYLLVDKKTLVISEKAGKKPTKIGERQGKIHKEDIKNAKRMENFFNELTMVETLKRKRRENTLLNFVYIVFRAFVPGFGKVREPDFN